MKKFKDLTPVGKIGAVAGGLVAALAVPYIAAAVAVTAVDDFACPIGRKGPSKICEINDQVSRLLVFHRN